MNVNMNIPAIARGKLTEADFQPSVSACTSDACQQGRKPCPTPQACAVPAPERRSSGWLIALIWLGSAAISAGIMWMAIAAVQP